MGSQSKICDEKGKPHRFYRRRLSYPQFAVPGKTFDLKGKTGKLPPQIQKANFHIYSHASASCFGPLSPSAEISLSFASNFDV